MHTLYTLWVSTLSFQLLAEVNGPAKADDDSKIIMVNSCVAYGCTTRSRSGVCFHNIPCDKERHELWLIALKPAKQHDLKHARLCCEHFLVENHYPNYKMQSESNGRSANSRYLSKFAVPSVFPF